MGGGPSWEQKQAAAKQAQASDFAMAEARDKSARESEQYGLIKPYATQRLENGLPFASALSDYNSVENAKGYAPARAQILRSTERFGSSLPSGFRERLLANLEAQRARSFDSGQVNNLLMNEQAKSEAARLLTGQQQIANPIGWTGAAMQGNQSVMQAPLQSPGLGGLLGGIAGGVMSKIPF